MSETCEIHSSDGFGRCVFEVKVRNLESQLTIFKNELVAINKGAETNIHLARSTSDENKKLKAELGALREKYNRLEPVSDEAWFRLEAENARYRGALARIVGHRRTIHQAEYNFAKGMEHIAQSALRPVGTEGPEQCKTCGYLVDDIVCTNCATPATGEGGTK